MNNAMRNYIRSRGKNNPSALAEYARNKDKNAMENYIDHVNNREEHRLSRQAEKELIEAVNKEIRRCLEN